MLEIDMGGEAPRILTNFLELLDWERSNYSNFLLPDEEGSLSQYCTRTLLLPPVDASPIIRKQYCRRVCRLAYRYVTERLADEKYQKVLDAGCGFGTETLLFALLGKKVTAVDLSCRRLNIAKKRISFFAEHSSQKLEVNFLNTSVFNLSHQFDVIWVREAISHIDAAEEFLEFAYERLRPGGLLFITDGNGMFLPLQLKLLFERGTRLHRQVLDPSTREEVPYAVERIFTIPRIKRILRTVGLSIVHCECSIGAARKSPDWLWNRVMVRLGSVPIISDILGRQYTIVAGK